MNVTVRLHGCFDWTVVEVRGIDALEVALLERVANLTSEANDGCAPHMTVVREGNPDG